MLKQALSVNYPSHFTATVFLLHPAAGKVTLRTLRKKWNAYNIFIMMNMSSVGQVALLLQTIGQESRLQILLAIGKEEPCVCHLEATFGWRQAFLSQHLMALRKAGLVETSRQGRNIHYRLTNPRLLAIIQQAAEIQGVSLPELGPSLDCSCPNCSNRMKP
jgi:DNA-binding transcriptional ArsR family regulator